MRATVRRCFCDKERALSFYGEGMEYEGSEARVRELTSLGYLEPAGGAAVAAETPVAGAEGPTPTEPEPAQAEGAGQGETPPAPAEKAPKAATKPDQAKRASQKKPAARPAAKKVSAGGGLRDKI